MRPAQCAPLAGGTDTRSSCHFLNIVWAIVLAAWENVSESTLIHRPVCRITGYGVKSGRRERCNVRFAAPPTGVLMTAMPSAPAAILALAELAPYLPARGSLLGLDLGTKTIGVATSDPDRRLATAVETIARTRFSDDAMRLLALAAERKAVAIVLGLPINMDGSEGPSAQSARSFARNLARMTDLPIALWDERLSTAAVERELIAADMSRARRKTVIDQHAAIFILQGALDRLAHIRGAATRE
jgi:putative holliday junction resolvase